MSMSRNTRLATIAALAAVSIGSGVLAVPATAAPSAVAVTADAAEAPRSGTFRAAAPIMVTGQAGWGFKASWHRYITGIAEGTVTTAGGAAQTADGVISYPVAHGTVDPAGRDAEVRFGGSVTYAAPKHKIDELTLSALRVKLVDGKGTLYMNVDSVLEGATASAKDVPIATLAAPAGTLTGGTFDWKKITAALTSEGSKIFALEGRPMYPTGTALDNLALSGAATVPALTVSQVNGLGPETEVTVSGTGYHPGRGVYLAQTVKLPGNTFPSVFGNAAYIRQVAADGTFTTKLKIGETFASGGNTTDCRTTACFVASFNSNSADATWMPSRAQDVAAPLSFGALKVTGQPSSSKVRSGATATFTAAADGDDSVRWERSTDRGTTWTAVPGATSAKLSVKATTALNDTRYRAVFTNTVGSETTSAATLTVTAVPSRITGLNATPEPVAKGSRLTVKGTLQAVGATDETWRALPKTPVVVEFRAKGAKTWTKAASATTDTKGVFSAGATASKDGDWRARYAGTADRAPVNSGSDYVDVKLRTEVKGFNASPEPVRKGRQIKVEGTLRTLDGKWSNTSGHTMSIWFKADGAKSWSKMGTARTNGKGAFWKYFTAKKDGSWKSVLDATSSRLGTTSGSDRVDVR
ncbi:HtaA domain-containing protein [Streptomyces sp. NPDC020141]|uniref:HtaA domain-containing protein n=1 Tax=Streptomyces sp. NPDC020141 TaxID=3365065 RepID=UPI003799BE2B